VLGTPFEHLQPGREYVVLESFVDFDRIEHPVGERWVFEGHAFLPYDDGLTLMVTDRWIRLQWRDDAQGPIIDALDRYIGPVAP